MRHNVSFLYLRTPTVPPGVPNCFARVCSLTIKRGSDDCVRDKPLGTKSQKGVFIEYEDYKLGRGQDASKGRKHTSTGELKLIKTKSNKKKLHILCLRVNLVGLFSLSSSLFYTA